MKHKHFFKLSFAGTWWYVWDCECRATVIQSKTHFKHMMLGGDK